MYINSWNINDIFEPDFAFFRWIFTVFFPWLWNSTFSFFGDINPGIAWFVYPLTFILVLVFYLLAVIFFLAAAVIFFLLTFVLWLLCAIAWVIISREGEPGIANTSEPSIQFIKLVLLSKVA